MLKTALFQTFDELTQASCSLRSYFIGFLTLPCSMNLNSAHKLKRPFHRSRTHCRIGFICKCTAPKLPDWLLRQPFIRAFGPLTPISASPGNRLTGSLANRSRSSRVHSIAPSSRCRAPTAIHGFGAEKFRYQKPDKLRQEKFFLTSLWDVFGKLPR